MTVIEQAQAIREAMDVAGASLTDEKALECVRLYRPWEVGRVVAVGEFLTYGFNSVGDPQLYKVIIEHTAQADWTPDTSPSLFKAIGLDDEGYPVWSQPTGAHDAYNTGDIVNYNGTLYESLIDGNIWAPDAYPAGWKVYTESEDTPVEDEDIPVEDEYTPTEDEDIQTEGEDIPVEGEDITTE